MVIKADEYMLDSVKIDNESLRIQFLDGETGRIPLDELSVGQSITEITRESIKKSGGERVQFILENGETVNYPWDFFRRLIDDKFKKMEKKESLRARKKLGERIRSLRTQQSLSQKELAERAGLDRTTISRIERGKHQASFDTLHSMAGGLQVSVQKIVSIEDEPAESVA